MKLPIIASLLLVSTVLQSPIVSAQIRGENPNHSGENRGDNRGNDGGRPGRYDGGGHGGGGYTGGNPGHGGYDNGHRGDHGGGIRPNPRPEPYPGPYRPSPGPHHPYPHPEPRRPDPYPSPYPYPHPHPHPRPEPSPYPRPYPNPYPDYPRDNYSEASVQFYSVTRRVNGEWLRVGFNYPAYLDYVMVDVNRAALRVHEAYAVTQSGRRILLSNLSYSGIIYAGQNVWSEYISAGERITAIDIRAESMGDYANVSVRVSSRYEGLSVYPIRY